MSEGKKILLVEDEKFLSMVLKSRLEKEGYAVIVAGDGEVGLAALRSEQPNLVVLDLIIPKVSGFEFLETMRQDPQISGTPVVVASNLGQDSDIQKARNYGVLDYYVKATTPVDDIVSMVNSSFSQNA